MSTIKLLPPVYPTKAFKDGDKVLDEIENSEYSIKKAVAFDAAMQLAILGISKDSRKFRKANPGFKDSLEQKAYIKDLDNQKKKILKSKKKLAQYLALLNVMFHNWDHKKGTYMKGSKFNQLKEFWKNAEKERKAIMAPLALPAPVQAPPPASAPQKSGKGNGAKGKGKSKGTGGSNIAGTEFHSSRHGLFAAMARQNIRAREGNSHETSFFQSEMRSTPVSTKQDWMSRLGI